jgi:hypothetical protein
MYEKLAAQGARTFERQRGAAGMNRDFARRYALPSASLLLIVGIISTDEVRTWRAHNSPCPPPVKLHRSTGNGCDANGDCHFDFLQPDEWGRCVESEDETLFCRKGETISHYNKQSKLASSWKTKACPALAEQVEKEGQAPELWLQIEIPAPTAPQPKI